MEAIFFFLPPNSLLYIYPTLETIALYHRKSKSKSKRNGRLSVVFKLECVPQNHYHPRHTYNSNPRPIKSYRGTWALFEATGIHSPALCTELYKFKTWALGWLGGWRGLFQSPQYSSGTLNS